MLPSHSVSSRKHKRGDKPLPTGPDSSSETSVCIKAEAVNSFSSVRLERGGASDPFSKCYLPKFKTIRTLFLKSEKH